MNVMSVQEIIDRVTRICRKHDVCHLKLFGSNAKGTAGDRSDVDFVVYGCDDILSLEEEISEIPTLRKIDIFDYNEVSSPFLKKEMDSYGKIIY